MKAEIAVFVTFGIALISCMWLSWGATRFPLPFEDIGELTSIRDIIGRVGAKHGIHAGTNGYLQCDLTNAMHPRFFLCDHHTPDDKPLQAASIELILGNSPIDWMNGALIRNVLLEKDKEQRRVFVDGEILYESPDAFVQFKCRTVERMEGKETVGATVQPDNEVHRYYDCGDTSPPNPHPPSVR